MARKPSLGVRALVAVAVILGVIWLPFELLLRGIGGLLPGARKRAAQDARDFSEASASNARQLIAAIAPDLTLPPDDGDAWQASLDMLQDAARIGIIDWRSEPDELREALDPMLARHGAQLDWSFVDDLVAREDWGAINNERLIPRVGREIAKLGLVLAHIDEGSDAYVMAVCPPAAFAKIDGLKIDGGAVRVRRFG